MVIRFYIKGVEFCASFWFLAALALFLTLDAGNLAAYFLLPIAAHELGHVIMLIICGMRVRSVVFTAFGIDVKKAGKLGSYPKELAVAAAGVLANLAVSFALYFFAFRSMRVMLLIAANLAVAAFNLLPIGSLDGGSIVKLLSQRFFSPGTAFALSRAFSFLALVPLFALAFFLLMRPERNFTLLVVAVYLAIDIILSE